MTLGYFNLDPHKLVFHAAVRRFAARHIAPGARVLDIASNDFRMHELLPPVEYWAADIDEERLEAGRRRYPDLAVTTVQCDIRSLPFEDASFDAVVSTHTLVHLHQLRAKRRAMRELLRVLRPGGSLIFNIRATANDGRAPEALETLIEGRFGDVERIVQQRRLGQFWSRHVGRPARRARFLPLTGAVNAAAPVVSALDRFGSPTIRLYLCRDFAGAEAPAVPEPAAAPVERSAG